MLEPPGTTPAANSTGGVWTAPPRGGHPTHTGAAAMHDHQGAEKGSGSTTEPVCGMTVEPATTPHTATHSGKHHYFCSEGSLAKLRSEERSVGTECGSKCRTQGAAADVKKKNKKKTS